MGLLVRSVVVLQVGAYHLADVAIGGALDSLQRRALGASPMTETLDWCDEYCWQYCRVCKWLVDTVSEIVAVGLHLN